MEMKFIYSAAILLQSKPILKQTLTHPGEPMKVLLYFLIAISPFTLSENTFAIVDTGRANDVAQCTYDAGNTTPDRIELIELDRGIGSGGFYGVMIITPQFGPKRYFILKTETATEKTLEEIATRANPDTIPLVKQNPKSVFKIKYDPKDVAKTRYFWVLDGHEHLLTCPAFSCLSFSPFS